MRYINLRFTYLLTYLLTITYWLLPNNMELTDTRYQQDYTVIGPATARLSWKYALLNSKSFSHGNCTAITCTIAIVTFAVSLTSRPDFAMKTRGDHFLSKFWGNLMTF